jgi:hypothetical protein
MGRKLKQSKKERRNTYSTTAYHSWDGVGSEYGGVDEDRGYSG